ncbi:unnamed protein product, partial [Choristocarpus tenellus]
GGTGGVGGGEKVSLWAGHPQCPSSLPSYFSGQFSSLPTISTFEESGRRVCWADNRGQRLSEVHEIEPGYRREDFALPGHIGFSTEACTRDMSKKEEKLLGVDDHKRLATVPIVPGVSPATAETRSRTDGGSTSGDSEGTMSDSENSLFGEPMASSPSSLDPLDKDPGVGSGVDRGGSSNGKGGSDGVGSGSKRRGVSGDGDGGGRTVGGSIQQTKKLQGGQRLPVEDHFRASDRFHDADYSADGDVDTDAKSDTSSVCYFSPTCDVTRNSHCSGSGAGVPNNSTATGSTSGGGGGGGDGSGKKDKMLGGRQGKGRDGERR